VLLLGVAALGLLAAGGKAGEARAAVSVWEGTETIPTYEEGPPDVNPPFDLFGPVRFNYPYTMRENLTDRRTPRVWRTLHLENEHLRVTVLPDLGGRLWRCIDKANGRSMFYANPTLKFAHVAYRGAWATFGIEFNFPVSHNWMTSSPVDFALVPHEGGSASIVVGNVDLVYGMQWRVTLTLRPGRAVLEQATALYNRSDVRHRFYWWTNAAVGVDDDSVLVYPMELTASHGFTQIDTWPISQSGMDLRRPGNHLQGPVSLFSHGSREPFMGAWHPRTGSGVAYYSEDLKGRKVWTWGADAEGIDWRRALSDDESAEAELQAGLFRNQETYAFLEPQETIRFREYWMPVRETSGLVRATPEAVLNLERAKSDDGRESLRVALNVTERVTRGRLRVRAGGKTVAEESLALEPSGVFTQLFALADPKAPATVEVEGDRRRLLIAHTEDIYDVVPRSEVKIGPQPRPVVPPPPGSRTEVDFAEIGRQQELLGKLLVAYGTYAEGLSRFPASRELRKAAGRLAVDLKRFEEAEAHLDAALETSNDAEAHYYRSLALLGVGRPEPARQHLALAAQSRSTRSAALGALARLLAREGRHEEALDRVRDVLRESPDAVRLGTFEVILLRRLGRRDEAAGRLAHWRRVDPTNATLRHEDVMRGAPGDALFHHLAADPQRVLEAALDYMELGAWDEALALLAREYPIGEGVQAEPGMPAPQRHPEVAYYRGYCREKRGESGRSDFEVASRLPTTYVFPQRAQSLPVLRRALEVNPDDATAHFLLGSLFLSGGMAERAIQEWEAARRLPQRIPVLHRNLGLALLHTGRDFERARAVLEEGASVDPDNAQVYEALDQALVLLDRPGEERVHALQRYPDPTALPPSLVLKLAVVLAEAGRFGEAERAFHGRFFPREEFGTNVRQVWVEVQLRKAVSLAREGNGTEARAVAESIGRPVPGLDFTKDGLEVFVNAGRTQYLLGEAKDVLGDAAGARAHWEKALAATDGYPSPGPAFAMLAAARLGGGRSAEIRQRIEAALQDWENRLVTGTNYPGPNAVGRGLFLRALGREEEGLARLREGLLLPDKLLSHELARVALAEKASAVAKQAAPPR
jgi:tetratricopeptide (TPR) repeat protein